MRKPTRDEARAIAALRGSDRVIFMKALLLMFRVEETAFSSKGILQIHQVAPDTVGRDKNQEST